MLRNDLYHVVRERRDAPDQLETLVSINPDHTIFGGHFPGQPVMPGVCMLQMIRELVENVVQKKMIVSTGDNIKFLSMLDPRQVREVNVSIQFGQREKAYDIQASIFFDQVTYFKFKGAFREV